MNEEGEMKGKRMETLPIASISDNQIGKQVVVEGSIVKELPYWAGLRLELDDGTDTIEVVLWRNVHDAFPEKDLLVPGTRIWVKGRIDILEKGKNKQIIPRMHQIGVVGEETDYLGNAPRSDRVANLSISSEERSKISNKESDIRVYQIDQGNDQSFLRELLSVTISLLRSALSSPNVKAGFVAAIVFLSVIGIAFLAISLLGLEDATAEENPGNWLVGNFLTLFSLFLAFGATVWTHTKLKRKFLINDWTTKLAKEYGEKEAVHIAKKVTAVDKMVRRVVKQTNSLSLFIIDTETPTRWTLTQQRVGNEKISGYGGFYRKAYIFSFEIAAKLELPSGEITHFVVVGGAPENRHLHHNWRSEGASAEALYSALSQAIEAGPHFEESIVPA